MTAWSLARTAVGFPPTASPSTIPVSGKLSSSALPPRRSAVDGRSASPWGREAWEQGRLPTDTTGTDDGDGEGHQDGDTGRRASARARHARRGGRHPAGH